MELPSRGYPVSEEAVTHWFVETYGRQPSPAEVGAILNAMAERDSSITPEKPAGET